MLEFSLHVANVAVAVSRTRLTTQLATRSIAAYHIML